MAGRPGVIYGFSTPWPDSAVSSAVPGPAEAPRVGGRLRPVVDVVAGAGGAAAASGEAGAVAWDRLDPAVQRQLMAVGWALLASGLLIVAGVVRVWGVEAGLWPLVPLPW